MISEAQELWWRQATSDFAIFRLLRGRGAAPCHQLHYLQMATEKLAKAYFWRTGVPPSRSHAAFQQFLKRLSEPGREERDRILDALPFNSLEAFRSWLRAGMPLAYELERVNPALADDGPNAEYPWPSGVPAYAPIDHRFAIWVALQESWQGRILMLVIEQAISQFPAYAGLRR